MANQEAVITTLEKCISSILASQTSMSDLDDLPSPPSLISTERKISTLGQNIDLLLQVLNVTKNEESRLHITRNRLLNARRAVNKLPDELLSMIFVEGDPCAVFKTPKYAHCIAAICSHWRDVALHTPTLWRHVTLHRRLPNLAIHPIERFHTYAQRSQPYSLDMELGLWSTGGGNETAKYIMRVAGPHLSRCHRLRITVGSGRILALIFPLRFPFPVLKHFSLRCGNGPESAEYECPIFHLPSPSLESLGVDQVFPLKPSFRDLDSQHIRRIFFNSKSREEVVELLAHCPALEILTWSDFVVPEPEENPVVLPLTVLLDLRGPHSIVALSTIVAPVLRHLLIAGLDEHNDLGTPHVLERCGPFPSLRSLGIRAGTFPSSPAMDPILANFIAAHAGLEILVIDCTDLKNFDGILRILWMLTLRKLSNAINDHEHVTQVKRCPNLKALILPNVQLSAPAIGEALSDALLACLETRKSRTDIQIRITTVGQQKYLQTFQQVVELYPENIKIIQKSRNLDLQACASLEPMNSCSDIYAPGLFDLKALTATVEEGKIWERSLDMRTRISAPESDYPL